MRVAIVSDPLVRRGGAERVVEQLAQAFPDAPVYTLLYSPQNGPRSLRNRVITSALQRIPGALRRDGYFVPFYPSAIAHFELHPFDVVISSHHTAAKGLIHGAQTLHVCYCHQPMPQLWERPQEILAMLPRPARRFAASLLMKLRTWDTAAAARVDIFIANSEETRRHIRAQYGRESTVIHPPIDLDRFSVNGTNVGNYYLVVVPPKLNARVDLAVAACATLGRNVAVLGAPPTMKHAPNIHLFGRVSEERLVDLMRGARALICPLLEGFGVTPLEVMACGRPVIAFDSGGARETVVDGVTGLLVAERSADGLMHAIERFETMTWDPRACRARAEEFSAQRFRESVRALVEQALEMRASPANAYAQC